MCSGNCTATWEGGITAFILSNILVVWVIYLAIYLANIKRSTGYNKYCKDISTGLLEEFLEQNKTYIPVARSVTQYPADYLHG
jgi:hypothetical protein